MIKNDILLKLDVKVAAHSEVVQNTSKTPKLSISDHISSLKSKLPLKNSFRKFVIFHFLAILTRRICNIRSASFALLSKSLRVKNFKESRLIFAFFRKFVKFFKDSKNKKVQTLWSLSFHAIGMV